MASRRASAAPARKAASASVSGALTARAQAGNGGGEAAGRLWIACESARASMRKRYAIDGAFG